ncbi:F-box protein At5g51370-like isoform X1 [Salvia splendens]|uniref:F-box protein At5g51370-like isoform X1 n=1 Tax=Salvia splendens TaxID=180675 RepID=UPI001C276E48|nr:F-box protein At5g51370-like isoform X1 [Salvia splendens]XP_042013738.1 F-box protein At5g51370-like isoform X1 [Salvia splendens]XP_042013739.1 F-box protein At5g51370-like isoform X1 [Salvia splendens]
MKSPSSPQVAPILNPNSSPNKNMHDPDEALKHALLKSRPCPFSQSGSTSPYSESEPESDASNHNPLPAATSLLSDELLLKVLDKIHDRKQHITNSLVCRRWCVLSGKLVKSIKLIDREFLESGRLSFRFPNLEDVNLVPACIKSARNSGILLSNKLIEVRLSSGMVENGEGLFVRKGDVFESKEIDIGVAILAEGCKNLTRVVLMNVSEEGLSCLAKECELLQEMELHNCGDFALRGIYNCKNLQILKLNGNVNGVYDSVVSDIGLTILAQGCSRLVKLELVGCEGSYDGIKAIGQCCQMLEELTICDHRMEGGWLSALSYCRNLKSLSFQSCKKIDENPGLDEHLGSCMILEELHLRKCHMQDNQGVKALFVVCRSIRELVLEDCWGLDDSVFAAATIFSRSIRSLSLKGCSILTTQGLESVLLSWKELDRLRVVSCNNIKDSEITAELATLFSLLKELKWQPDSRSMLSASLAGTGIGQKGSRSLRWN